MNLTPVPVNREELIAKANKLLEDPLARRYWQKVMASDVDLRQPEDVLGCRLLVIARWLLEGTDDEVTRAADGYTDNDRWETLEAISTLALGAAPYLWTEVAWSNVWGLHLPAHVISPRALPLPYMWHTFDLPRKWGDAEMHLGFLITDGNKGLSVYDFIAHDAPNEENDVLGVEKIYVPYGATWPDDFDTFACESCGENDCENGGRPKVEKILKLLAFLGSPFIPRTRERMNRSARREIARKGSEVDAEEEVTFVLLRRVTPGKKEKSETEQEVAWKHRWLVSGHLRAQWYPSEGAHHLVWIAPYMKGPEDAPLLEHVYKVAR